jgi:crotonobetainyl-CoA:carnitine CoA-transferase CaiB-like acyl-CoA transferase
VSLYSAGQWLTTPNLILSSLLSLNPVVPGDRHEHSPLRNRFRCKDGKWIIGTHHPEDKYWPVFCEATGQKELVNDPRFATEAARKDRHAELVRHFDKVFATKTCDEWMEIFLEKGLMFCSVQTVQEVHTDPQALANNYIVDFDDPSLGRVKLPGYPVHFSACRAGTRKLAPRLGEHTDVIMQELGYRDGEIQRLKKEGVVR